MSVWFFTWFVSYCQIISRYVIFMFDVYFQVDSLPSWTVSTGLRNDLPQYQTPWTCDMVGSHTPPKPVPVPAPSEHSDGKCIPNYHVNCSLTCLLLSSFWLCCVFVCWFSLMCVFMCCIQQVLVLKCLNEQKMRDSERKDTTIPNHGVTLTLLGTHISHPKACEDDFPTLVPSVVYQTQILLR